MSKRVISASTCWLVLAILILLAARGALYLSQAWSNAGLVIFNRALTAGSADPTSQTITQAEALLRRAITYSTENRSAWRGLGFTLVAKGREDEAVTAWQNAAQMPGELVQWGERARKARQYQLALVWYERATKVEPGLRDPWYHVGLALEEMKRWEEASEAYHRGLQMPVAGKVGLSDFYFRLGQLRGHRAPEPDWQTSLSLCNQALALDSFSGDWSRIQAHYTKGEALRNIGRKREAMEEFEWVIVHRPSDYWAHVHLGVLTWEELHDAGRAEILLLRALDIDGNSKWAYRALGLVYQGTGRWTEAIEMYSQVLLLDRSDAVAREQLAKIPRSTE